MKTKIVRHRLGELPPLTEENLQNLERLATRPEGEIDTSDIPEISEKQWKDATRGRFYRGARQENVALVDADVAVWLKAKGDNFDSRINEILRREMRSETTELRKAS